MAEFEPITCVAEHRALDETEVLDGYLDGFDGAPCPDGSRSRGYQHGWRNGMRDAGRLAPDAASRALAASFRALGERDPHVPMVH